jgi:hypothetical protein
VGGVGALQLRRRAGDLARRRVEVWCVRYALAAGGWRLAGLGGEDGWMDVVDVYRSVAVDEDEDVGVICVISTIYLSMRMCSERRRAGIPIRPPS